ncbi:MAG: hypothetical protein E6J34_20345, partial [Chloroflexi bacterium]
WQVVLSSEGFGTISLPTQDIQQAGQQVIVAAVDRACSCSANTDMDLREKSCAYLKELVGKVLNLPSAKIDTTKPLTNYGLDSILVIQLTEILRTSMEQISTTLFFEYTTIDALVEHFLHTQKEALRHLVGAGDDKIAEVAPTALSTLQYPLTDRRNEENQTLPPVSPDARASNSTLPNMSRDFARERDIAIIGIAGRYPEAKDVLAFWDLLKAGKSAIREIPPERWDWRSYFQAEKGATRGSRPAQAQGSVPTIYAKWGGFLEDIECFDASFFHISPRESEQMDPQERLFLEVSYTCIQDAGYTPAGLGEHGPVGVFVGVMNGNYPTGARYWSIANRASFVLGLQGPSVAVDTACSSSLTALHFAVESLISGTSACAIVGGVNLIVDPVHYVRLSQLGMLASSDQCKSFGENADGFVDGEGVGAILLKPLKSAEADGDHIYGVIKATAINHGGKTNGYTVPNPHAQADVIKQALQRAGIDPRTISYVEAHGTGTVLGDPIEIAGLTRAFIASGETQNKQYCAIGSVKSNIGHTESAAGIAGVTKALLQMRYGQLVPSLHAEALNPYIDFEATPFVVQRELSEWKRPQIPGIEEVPRRAGVSSFGAGGSNAHVILEEYMDKQRPCSHLTYLDGVRKASPSGPALIVLSARTEEQLNEQVRQLLSWIQKEACADGACRLDDLAYTLQVGREAMEERLAMLVGSLQELEEKLHRYVSDSVHKEGDWYRGQVKRHDAIDIFATDEDGQKMVVTWVSKGKYGKLLSFWVKGGTIDWKLLYAVRAGSAQGTIPTAPTLPRRISLPTYPFARESYWISTAISEPTFSSVNPASTNRVALRPLADHSMLSHMNKQTALPTVDPELAPRLEEELARSLAQALYMQESHVDIEKPFVEMGLDSVSGVEWIWSLNKRYATNLNATCIYDYPTIRQLAGFLRKELSKHAAVIQQTPVPLIPTDFGLAPEAHAAPEERSQERGHSHCRHVRKISRCQPFDPILGQSG